MKSILLSALVVSFASLVGCQSSQAPAAASRTLEVTGAQSRFTAQLPETAGPASPAAPFALQGATAGSPAMVPTSGFQAR